MNRLSVLRQNWRRVILPCVIVLYVLTIVGYGLVWLVTRDHYWQMDLLSNFTAWYFLPAPILLLITLLFKRKRWVILLFIPLAIFAFKYGPRFLPRETKVSAADSQTLTVMTMNMLKRNTNWGAVQAQIQAANPDIVTIQEIPDDFFKSTWQTLAETYPYNMHVYSEPELSTMGILSRYPIVAQEIFGLPNTSFLKQLRAVIDVNGQRIVVYNLHLTAPKFQRPFKVGRLTGLLFPYEYTSYYRRWEMGFFNEHLQVDDMPALVMGDLNTADSSVDYNIFHNLTNLTDTFGEVGFGMGFTFPTDVTINQKQIPFIPLMRLDYIWHSAQWQPLSAWLGGSTGSDHLPVIARLKLVAQ